MGTAREELGHASLGSLSDAMQAMLADYARAARQVMKRRHRAILGGKHIQFGNQYSETAGNRSRRTWKPNVQTKRIYSEALQKFMKLRVSTYVLKRCDAKGGLDNYLLKTPDSLLHSDLAVRVKRQIIDALYEQGRLNEVLGLQSSYLPPGASYQPSLPKPVPLEVLRRFAEERANARANRGAGAERVNAVQADS